MGCAMSVSMNYKNLGRSGLKVSRICLGTNNFGGQVSEEDSIKIVNKAVDCGINGLDTADIYTGGKSEEIIGKRALGIPTSKLAIAWILKNSTMTVPIVGASSIEQVEENCRLTEINVQDEVYQKLNKLTKNVSVFLYS